MASASPHELSVAFAEAVNTGDIDGALELWSPDAVLIGPGGEPIHGRESIAQALTALIGSGTRVEIVLGSLHATGSVAVASGTLTLTAGDGFAATSQSIVVYERGDDERWRIALDAPWGLGGAG